MTAELVYDHSPARPAGAINHDVVSNDWRSLFPEQGHGRRDDANWTAVLDWGCDAIRVTAYRATACRRASMLLTLRHDPGEVAKALDDWDQARPVNRLPVQQVSPWAGERW